MIRGKTKVVVWRRFPSPTLARKPQQIATRLILFSRRKPKPQTDSDQKMIDRWMELADMLIGADNRRAA